MIKEGLAIFIGGGTGSLLRYFIQYLIHERLSAYHIFPWSTFIVNIIGSFMIGMFYALSARYNIGSEVRLLLTAGLCGGFTTFSTFSNDNLEMIRQGCGLIALLYIVLSVAIGIAACFLGASTFK